LCVHSNCASPFQFRCALVSDFSRIFSAGLTIILFDSDYASSNCDDTPLLFEAVINDQCVDGLKWSYPYIIYYDIDNCTTSPYIKADYGTCIYYQKMVLGGAPPPPNSEQDSSRSDDDVFTEVTVSIVVVVVVIVFVAALLLYRYCLIGHFVFSISAHYSSVQITQGIAYPVQNDQVILELPTIYEGHNDIPDNNAPIYPTYTDAITHAPPVVEGVAVVMTTNDV
jgi:hypothetical protein